MLASESLRRRLSASFKGTLRRGQKRFRLELFKKRANELLLQSPGKDATPMISLRFFTTRPFFADLPVILPSASSTEFPGYQFWVSFSLEHHWEKAACVNGALQMPFLSLNGQKSRISGFYTSAWELNMSTPAWTSGGLVLKR